MKIDHFWDEFFSNPKLVVHCKTRAEAKKFCSLMDSHGAKWRNGDSYLKDTWYSVSGSETCYTGHGTHGSCNLYKNRGCTIIEFDSLFGGEV